MVPVSDKESPVPPVHHIDSAKPGSIIVISAPPGLPNAVFGGLMAARAQFLQAKGAVIDGRCRDLQELRESIKFPVFARGISCLGAGKYCRLTSINEPILIGSITVSPNDVIIGDLDGVVRIPAEQLATVIKKCEELTAIDGRCMDDIIKGRPIKETFAEHRVHTASTLITLISSTKIFPKFLRHFCIDEITFLLVNLLL